MGIPCSRMCDSLCGRGDLEPIQLTRGDLETLGSDPKHVNTQADGSTAQPSTTGVQMTAAAPKAAPKKAAPSAGAPGQVRMDLPDNCSKEAVDYVPLLDSAQEFRICQTKKGCLQECCGCEANSQFKFKIRNEKGKKKT